MALAVTVAALFVPHIEYAAISHVHLRSVVEII